MASIPPPLQWKRRSHWTSSLLEHLIQGLKAKTNVASICNLGFFFASLNHVKVQLLSSAALCMVRGQLQACGRLATCHLVQINMHDVPLCIAGICVSCTSLMKYFTMQPNQLCVCVSIMFCIISQKYKLCSSTGTVTTEAHHNYRLNLKVLWWAPRRIIVSAHS